MLLHAQKGVGINTDSPQQALHVAGAQNTIRVEGLSYLYNAKNTGDINGDGVLTNDTFPLYVNKDGVFDLDLDTFFASEDLDAIPVAKTITLTPFQETRTEEIHNVVITVPRPSIIEIKYNLGFEVYADASLNSEISDFLARRITTYFQVDDNPRTYGIDSKSFTNLSSVSLSNNTGSKGTFYNVGSAYISLPSAGQYTLRIFGQVSSGTSHLGTSVIFGAGTDSLLYRIY